MLILFHYISILIFEILQKRKRQKSLKNVKSVDSEISTFNNSNVECTESNTSKFKDSNTQSSICNDLNLDSVDNETFINSNVGSIDGENFTFNDLNVEFEYNKTTFYDTPKENLINRDIDTNIIKDMEELKLQEDITIDEDLDNFIKFDPPVFRQRYAEVYTTLINEKWRTKVTKLCDFGCAELGLFTFIKRLNRLTDILFVDIDENLLKDNARKIQPLTIEYLKRREEPLTVSLCAGSVADPDYRILNTDVITAIELIEHLYPDVLDAFPYNIFSYVEPKLVIITTPNADFNILFSSDPKRFRHYDHKFEWTREQFEDWANNIVTRFPDYSVTFSGLGEGPIGTENLGYCSQMALFVRKDLINEKYTLKEYSTSCICSNESQCKGLNLTFMDCKCVCPCCSPKSSYGVCTYYSYSKRITYGDQVDNENENIFYKAIETIEYPFERDNRTEEEKMMDEFRYRINVFGNPNSRFFVEDRERAEIPLKDLLYGPDWASITETELANLLAKNDYRIEKCVIPETDELETCVIFVPLMDNLTSSSEHSDFEDTNSGYFQSVKESLSDWDDDDAQQDLKDGNADSSISKDPSSNSDTLHDALSESDSSRSGARNKSPSRIPRPHIYSRKPQTVTQNTPPPSEEQEETDLFEDTTSTPSLASQDNKVHLKRASAIEKTGFIPPPPPLDVNKMKLDFNRINELDRIHNIPIGRNFFGHLLRPQTEKLRKSYLKDRDCLPGPSNIPAKKRKKMRVAGMTSDSEDDVTPLDDMKSVTNCIVENTLNKLNVDEVKANKDDVIEFNLVPVEETEEQKLEELDSDVDMENNGNNVNDPKPEGDSGTPISQNVPDENLSEPVIENYRIRLAVDLLLPIEHETNFSHCPIANAISPLAPMEILPDLSIEILPNTPYLVPQIPSQLDDINDQDEMNGKSIARASREAIVDPNSVQDLLADFDVNATIDELNGVDILDLGNVILVGIHPLSENIDVEQNTNGFPNWLLHILGTQAPISEMPMDGTLEEPHYYCQGDGLGVHPSVIAVDVNEVDSDDEHSSQSSDNTNTTDFAEIGPGMSSQDMSSLPEDSIDTILTTELQDCPDEADEREPSSAPASMNCDTESSSSDMRIQTSKSL